jgi:membrane protein CcdC involved in cytochrome C biogenesis
VNIRGKSKRKFEKDRQLTLMLLGSAIAFLLLTLPTEINDIIRIHSDEKPVTEKAYLLSAILSALAHLNYAVRSFFFLDYLFAFFFLRSTFIFIH